MAAYQEGGKQGVRIMFRLQSIPVVVIHQENTRRAPG
jgi:hypothetical protein|tara:strand:+ start:917 stop:1027 length:111 start_codon:yes stop_codon:yes gene_type:complete